MRLLRGYRLESAPFAFGRDAVQALLLAAGSAASPREILADAYTLARTCPLSVVGIDGGSEGTRGALKLDWSEVPPATARAVVASRGARAGALARIDELATHLRARWLSYLGLKYDDHGFTGWRAYFATEPHRYVRPCSPSVVARSRLFEGSRMPHY